MKPLRRGLPTARPIGYRVSVSCPNTVRGIALAYHSDGRLPRGLRNIVVPALVVEVASFSETRRELNVEALMWLRYGVRLVWVAEPETHIVEVHKRGAQRVASLRWEHFGWRRCAARFYLCR